MIPENLNVNLDQSSKTLEQCLKEVWHFGHTTYMNICSGQVNDVPWGGLDWLVTILIVVIVGGIGIGFMVAIFKMIFDYFNNQKPK